MVHVSSKKSTQIQVFHKWVKYSKLVYSEQALELKQIKMKSFLPENTYIWNKYG